MKDFGLTEVAGTSGYGSARIGLRAPRVAVRLDVAAHWQSQLGLAMSAASNIWGGYGFIYVPYENGTIHPALARILRAYDPDYLVDIGLTIGDMEAMIPGWLAARTEGLSVDDEDYPNQIAMWADQALPYQPAGDVGSNLCSPYYEPFHESNRFRKMQTLSEDRHGALHDVASVLGSCQRPTFEVSDGLDPLLTLALGLRAGFSRKPNLPLGSEVADIADRMPHDLVRYALRFDRDRRGLLRTELDGLATPWDLTSLGLLQIGRVRPYTRPIGVIGSTANDFALAFALDRMFGSVVWVPHEWALDENQRWSVTHAFDDLIDAARDSGHPPILTSVSLTDTELQAVIDTRWPEPMVWAAGDGGSRGTIGGAPPEIVSADKLNIEWPLHLACAGDYDLTVTLPTLTDGAGGFEFVLELPVQTPSHPALQTPQRPFWEVDIEVDRSGMPNGRDLRGASLLAETEPFPATVLRSGRNGISFNPANMLFVPAGASLTQAIAKPRLRVLSLSGWINAIIAQHHPGTAVRPSDAGRRATILMRLWGSRSAVADDLLQLGGYFREFRARSRKYSEAYPNGDGFPVLPGEGVLTLAAANRVLAGILSPEEVRGRINKLLAINVLQRGLVIRCSECERWAFHRVQALGETNSCSRCGAPARMQDARWSSEYGEPELYYDLHNAVRELVNQNGDVPLLAARTLADAARSYSDVVELDFITPDNEIHEVDLVAYVDDRLTVGEAKINAEIGQQKAKKTIEKLVRVSDLLGADEILLCTTASGPWKQAETDALAARISSWPWRFSRQPQLRVMTDLRLAKPVSVVVLPS